MDYTIITTQGHMVDFSTTDTLQDIQMELSNATFYHLKNNDGLEMIIRCSVVEAVKVNNFHKDE